jgi:hypothetical protein
MLRAYKSERGCVDCGYNENPVALQFDHVPERGEKLFQLSLSFRYNKEKVAAEILKCDVVCANCHAIRTAERRVYSNGN